MPDVVERSRPAGRRRAPVGIVRPLGGPGSRTPSGRRRTADPGSRRPRARCRPVTRTRCRRPVPCAPRRCRTPLPRARSRNAWPRPAVPTGRGRRGTTAPGAWVYTFHDAIGYSVDELVHRVELRIQVAELRERLPVHQDAPVAAEQVGDAPRLVHARGRQRPVVVRRRGSRSPPRCWCRDRRNTSSR